MAWQWRFLADLTGPPGDAAAMNKFGAIEAELAKALVTRGVLASGTDLNTLSGPEHAGVYSLPSSGTYPNAPARTTAGVLEVVRGSGSTLSLIQRITAGTVMVWREATDSATGTWSAWEQTETVSGSQAKDTANRSAWAAADTANLKAAKDHTDTQVAADRSRLSAIEPVKCVRLEAGKWVWDTTAGTHYVMPDHEGNLVIRITPWPIPDPTTPTIIW